MSSAPDFPLLATVDGALGPAGEATIPVTDDGLLRGDGAFEYLRLYDGRPFALEEHLVRLERSAGNLRLPLDLPAIRSDLETLLEAVGERDGCVRLLVTRGGRRILLSEPLLPMAPTIRLATVPFSPSRVLDGVKSLSYAANMLATRIAQERGYDEALLVTPHGRVLEAPTSTLFWVEDRQLCTPPLDEHILASITRAAVMETSNAVERPASVEDLPRASEAFLASTTREVQAVTAIDGQAYEPGPVTAEVAERLRDHVRSVLAAA